MSSFPPLVVALEELVAPEVMVRVTEWFGMDSLLRGRAVARSWRAQISAVDAAWKACFRLRFGAGAEVSTSGEAWMGRFYEAVLQDRRVASWWLKGSFQGQDAYIFTSYVRSWASDARTLVAGLSNGSLETVELGQNRLRRSLAGAHQDEVVCVAINEEHILSGSGDPGYYHRPPADASVQLWSRADGTRLCRYPGHGDSVRGVALFRSGGSLDAFGLSAGLDARARLWCLRPVPGGRHHPRRGYGVSAFDIKLPGPCRSLRAVPSAAACASTATEERVIASAGVSIVELAVLAPTETDGDPSIQLLRAIETSGMRRHALSGVDCFVPHSVWAWLRAGAAYPPSLLDERGVVAAAGGVCGGAWVTCGDGQPRAAKVYGSSTAGHEVVSVTLLGQRRLLSMSRRGALCCMDWEDDVSSALCLWDTGGWRMYVSTIRRLAPHVLISDGFDNVIRTLSVAPRDASEDEDG